jgi:hypothetical protein
MKRKTTKRAAKKKVRRKASVAKRRTTAPRKRAVARTRRRVKRRGAPKKPGAARRTKPKSAKPGRPARARRTKPKAAKRSKPAATKQAATTKRASASAVRTPGTARVAHSTPAAAALLRPAAPGGVAALVPLVEDELRRRGDDPPDPEVVSALATAGAGYRKGPGADPPFRIAIDVDERVAEGFVERYWEGDRSADPDRQGERRTTARQWVRFNLDQAGPAGATPTVIATLAAVALGAWKPNQDPLAQLNIYADAVAGWYRAGLS